MASNTMDTPTHDTTAPDENQITAQNAAAADQAQGPGTDVREPAEITAQTPGADGHRDTGLAPPTSDAQTAAAPREPVISPASEAGEPAPTVTAEAPFVVSGREPPATASSIPATPPETSPVTTVTTVTPSAEPAEALVALRAENERLRAELGAMRHHAARQETPHRVRRLVVNTLVVLSCLGLLFSTVAVWAQQTFLSNTNRWVQIVGPIGQDPAVINAVSAYTADQVVTLLQVQQRAQTALPQQAQFLAVPLTTVVRNFTQTQVTKAMQTDQFQQAWVTVNAAVHTQLVAALRGQSNALTISNNTLTLNLIPIISQGLQVASQQLSGVLPAQIQLPDLSNTQSVQAGIQRLSQALGVQLPSNYGQVVLLQSDQLATAQSMVRLLDALSILLPLLTLVFIVAALWLSRDRRRTLIQLGIGIVIVFLLAKIGIAYLEQTMLSSITNPTALSVAQLVVNQALSYIRTSTTWLVVIGALTALAAFLAGKPEWFKAGYAELQRGYGWTKRQAGKLRVQLQHAM
ncbi:MAG TPA: hypothetical protein VFY89_00660 [Ktedonobacterales bacterium]